MITPLRAALDGRPLKQGARNSLDTAMLQAASDAAKADQLAAIKKAEQVGDTFAAYWAGSASASVAHHVRRGAVVDVQVRKHG